jgi:phosphorylcholine metabolism protein LicD
VDVSILQEDADRLRKAMEEELNPLYRLNIFRDFQYELVFTTDTGMFLDIYLYRNQQGKMRLSGDVYTPNMMRSIPESIIFPLQEILFCGIPAHAPAGLDTYLRVRYGNYEVLPKKEHRDWKHNPIIERPVFYPDEI